VIAAAQFHDVAAHLAKQPPPFRRRRSSSAPYKVFGLV
jgi:hypothetical protein